MRRLNQECILLSDQSYSYPKFDFFLIFSYKAGGRCAGMCVLSHVRLFSTQWTVARQAPLSMGFSRQEYWSGLPFPAPGDLPIPGFKLVSPAQLMGSLPLSPWGALRPPTDEATACALHIEGEITADMQRTSFLGVELPPVFPALD